MPGIRMEGVLAGGAETVTCGGFARVGENPIRDGEIQMGKQCRADKDVVIYFFLDKTGGKSKLRRVLMNANLGGHTHGARLQ